MRALAAICFLPSVLLSFAAGVDRPDLKSLYDGHRWFELRDAVAKGDAPVFYIGLIACAFDDVRKCDRELEAVFKSSPQSDEAVEGHRTLASAYFRHGKYREALRQVDAILAVRPKDSDALDGRPLLAALAEFPDQKTKLRKATLELQDGGLPFSINGVKATYWFDTGAELSVMSESEAKRFALSVHKVEAKVGDVNGTLSKAEIAVADELSIGSVRLKHVTFLVLSDSQPPFNEGAPGSRGLIGIPVLVALEKFAWADRNFEISPKSPSDNVPHSNLCFDGSRPVAQVKYEDRTLEFTLDTGATNTDLYPPFAAAFPDLIRSATKTDSYKMEGVGGAKFMQAATLNSVRLRIGEFPVLIKSTGVLLQATTESSKAFAGNLGIDLLQQAHKTTFDFKAMRLVLQ
jgi:hypothetical protein